jgi:hypothetical protein
MEVKMRKQEYVVKLSKSERLKLKDITGKGKGSARQQIRARILLHADTSKAGSAWDDPRIAGAVGCCMALCGRVRKQYVNEGLDAVVTRKVRETPPVEPIFDGVKEARLIQLACSKPPEGRVRWTLRLLEDKLVELDIEASDNTIGRVLKKTNLSLI